MFRPLVKWYPCLQYSPVTKVGSAAVGGGSWGGFEGYKTHRPSMKTSAVVGYVQNGQTARAASPLPQHTEPRAKTAAAAHLLVVSKFTKQISLLFSLSPPTGPQVLEVALNLPLTALLCPARSRVFMCQWALTCRGAELNINSPRHTMLCEVEHLWGKHKRNTARKYKIKRVWPVIPTTIRRTTARVRVILWAEHCVLRLRHYIRINKRVAKWMVDHKKSVTCPPIYVLGYKIGSLYA